MLSASGLRKSFGRRLALSGVGFEVGRGERLSVIGPNGAGKTTLLSILAGTLRADGGTVAGAARSFGWVPQRAAVYRRLTVAENLRLFARLEGVADVAGAVERMLELATLDERRDDRVEALSGGNQQRLNIALGLVGDPDVLLLDEPSAALDPRQRQRLWHFVGGLSEHGTTVVFSTHNVSEAERYGDRLLVLADGELLYDGTPGGLRGAGADFEQSFVEFLREHGH